MVKGILGIPVGWRSSLDFYGETDITVLNPFLRDAVEFVTTECEAKLVRS